MKKVLLLSLLGLTFLLSGCTVIQPITPLERAQMRTETFNSDYKTTYKALMVTLENDGYAIENTDMNSGLIKATKKRNDYNFYDSPPLIASKKEKNDIYRTQRYGVTGVKEKLLSSTVTKINDKMTMVRVNIREETKNYVNVNVYGGVREINDPVVYRNIFNRLRVEIERYKAMY